MRALAAAGALSCSECALASSSSPPARDVDPPHRLHPERQSHGVGVYVAGRTHYIKTKSSHPTETIVSSADRPTAEEFWMPTLLIQTEIKANQ